MILDACAHDRQREIAADLYLRTGDMPPSLQPLSVARVTGNQTTYRAELTAVVCVSKWFPKSRYMLMPSRYWILLINAEHSWTELVQCEELDLVKRLWAALQGRDQQFQKIRADQEPHKVTNALDRYKALGNKRANDDTALQTGRHMYPSHAKLGADMATEVRREALPLKRLYKMHLELRLARSKQEQLDKEQDTSAQTADT